jgi:Fur family transcriptional regulator, ferric uptake regulator
MILIATHNSESDDVYRLLIGEDTAVSIATIYWMLMQFADAGILLRRRFETGHAVFELNEGIHHDHLICTSCGRGDEFADDSVENRQAAVAKERGFELQDHALSLYGTCAKCLMRKSPAPNR